MPRIKIDYTEYTQLKKLLKDPTDDQVVAKNFGLSARTAAEIRKSNSYRDYRYRMNKNRTGAEIAKELERAKQYNRMELEAMRDARKTAKMAGVIVLLSLAVLIALSLMLIIGGLKNAL